MRCRLPTLVGHPDAGLSVPEYPLHVTPTGSCRELAHAGRVGAARGTWLAWPHRRADWPGKFAPIRWVYAEIVRTLARFEPVHVIVQDLAQRALVTRTLKVAHADVANVTLHECPTDRSWLRDSGPIVVHGDAGRVALDWHFNGWAKYDDCHLDDAVPAFVAAARGLPTVQPHRDNHHIVMEGGSLDVNGAGLLLATEECWLSKTQERKPALRPRRLRGGLRGILRACKRCCG